MSIMACSGHLARVSVPVILVSQDLFTRQLPMPYNTCIHKTGFKTMFDKQLKPIYDGRVLVNETAMNNPVIQATLLEMSKRNFEPQRINKYGVWYISDRH